MQRIQRKVGRVYEEESLGRSLLRETDSCDQLSSPHEVLLAEAREVEGMLGIMRFD